MAFTDKQPIVQSIIRDSSGNAIGVVVNNSIYRFEGRSSLTSPDGVTDADVGTTAALNNRLSVASRLTDGTGFIDAIVANSIRRLEGRSSITSANGSADVDVTLEDTKQRLEVTGRVTAVPPSTPAGGTEVVIAQAEVDLSIGTTGLAHDTTPYVIPDGDTFFLQQFAVGAEGDPNEKGSKGEVYYNDGGTFRLVGRIYVAAGTNFETFPDRSKTRDGIVMVGNAGGTNTIVMRRVRLANSTQEVDGEVLGYVK